jgi:hypothetical protein
MIRLTRLFLHRVLHARPRGDAVYFAVECPMHYGWAGAAARAALERMEDITTTEELIMENRVDACVRAMKYPPHGRRRRSQ